MAALDRHETGAESVEAGEILVATGQVDLALASQRRVAGFDTQAVRLDRTIPATYADQRVDHHMAGRVLHRAALAPTTLFRGAGLLVDKDRDTLHLAQFPLHRVKIGAVMERGASRKIATRELVWIVRDQRNPLDPLSPAALRNRRRTDRPIHRLPAGHRNGVIVKDLVSDVCPSGDRLPDSERAGVIPSPLAKVLKDMTFSVET